MFHYRRTALVNQYLALHSVEATFPDINGQGLDGLVPAAGSDRVLVRNGQGLTVIDGLVAGRPDRWDVPVPAGFRGGGLIDGGAGLVVLAPDGDVLRWDLASRTGPERTHAGIVPPDPAFMSIDPAATRVGWAHPARPGVNVIELHDIRTGTLIPHRIAPIEDATAIRMEQTLDPDLVVIQLGYDAAAQGPLEVRSLSDGGVRQVYPAGSTTAATTTGTVVSCEQDGNRSVAVLRVLADGTQIRRLPLVSRCSGRAPLKISTDGHHLVETSVGGPTDSRIGRITRLVDGSAFGLTLPPDGRAVQGSRWDLALAVIDGQGPPTVLMAQGKSVLRLRAAPVLTTNDGTAWPADDGHVVTFDENGIAVHDRDFHRTAALTREEAGLTSDGSVFVNGGVAVLSAQPSGWTVTDFAVPSLQRRSVHELPATAQGIWPAVDLLADRIVVFSGFRITAWDRATGAQLYEPTAVPERTFRDAVAFAVRPDRPDEVAIPRNLGGELWDLREGRRIADVPLIGTLQPITYGYSPTGDRLVSIALGQNLDTRNRADLQPVGPTIPAPGVTGLLGVAQDGHVVTLQVGDVSTVAFWDVDRGAAAGSFSLPRAYRVTTVSDDGRYMRIGAGGGPLPFTLPVGAGDWAARLCSLVDGPFPGPVRDLLPQGVELDRPCGEG